MSTARSVEEVANGVGILLGEVPPIITDLNADETKIAKVVKERLPDLRLQFLRKHHWNFAIDRKRLLPTYQTITNVTDVGGKIRITIAAHGRATGDRITIEEVVGVPAANGTYYITVVDVNTLELDDSTFAGAYTSGGKATTAAQFDYSYKIALPAGFVKLVSVTDEPEYKVEGLFILSNTSVLYIRYVKDVATYETWDASAYKAFQHYIAIECCETITASAERKQNLVKEFEELIMPKAKNQDATEDPHTKTDDSWLHELRQSGDRRGFVRDPMT